MKLSIIIVSYKSDNVLFDCLNSISKFNDIHDDLEVIIIDNYLLSSLGDKLHECDYSFNLVYYQNHHNMGFGAANNIGVQKSCSDIIFFLNPDTVLLEPVFQDICNNIDGRENLIFGFTLIDKMFRKNNSYSVFYDYYFLLPIIKVLKCIAFYIPNNFSFLNRLIWPWGAAFAMAKTTFVNAGGFDENIFLCNEEPDLLRRIDKRKVFISRHKIVHLEGHGEVVSQERYYQFLLSLKYYFSKYNLHHSFFFFFIRVKSYIKYFFFRNINSRNFYLACKKAGI